MQSASKERNEMTDDKPKPYISIQEWTEGWFDFPVSDEWYQSWVDNGCLFAHIWADDIVVLNVIPVDWKECKCQPIFEKDGVRVDRPGEGVVRVDVKCDWCQNRMKERSDV
jgi:hypothetical protein